MTEVNSPDTRRAKWQKPTVRSITPVKRTAGGAKLSVLPLENAFYRPS